MVLAKERAVQHQDNSLPSNYRKQLLTLKLSMKRRRPKSLLFVVAAARVPSVGAISQAGYFHQARMQAASAAANALMCKQGRPP